MEPATTTMIVLKELAGNPPPRLNDIQELLVPHVELLTNFWIAVWIMTVIVLLAMLWLEYKKHRSDTREASY